MDVKPLIKLIKLDLRLLLNMGARAFKVAGALYSFPVILTMILFMIISTTLNIICPSHNSRLAPWMVRYQFIIAYRTNKT